MYYHPLYISDTLFHILSFLSSEYKFIFRKVSKYHRNLIPPSTHYIDFKSFATKESLSLVKWYGYHPNATVIASAKSVEIVKYICDQIKLMTNDPTKIQEKNVSLLDCVLSIATTECYITNNVEVMQYLYEIGFVPDIININKTTSFELLSMIYEKGYKLYGLINRVMKSAIKYKKLDYIKRLIKDGAIIDNKAVNTAASYGHTDILKWLIKKGAKINVETLNHAIFSGNIDLLTWLLTFGYDGKYSKLYFNLLDRSFYSKEKESYPILFMSEDEIFEIMKWLIDHKFRVVDNALSWALSSGFTKIANWLIKHDCVITWSALQIAMMRFYDIHKLLLEMGYKPDDWSQTMVHIACNGLPELQEEHSEDCKDLKYMKELGYSCDILMYNVVMEAPIEKIKWLLKNGAQCNANTFQNAIENNDLNKVKLIYDHRLAKSSDRKRTAKQDCSIEWEDIKQVDNLEILKWIHQHGCPLSCYIFSHAVKINNVSMIEWLIENNCPLPSDWSNVYKDLAAHGKYETWVALKKHQLI